MPALLRITDPQGLLAKTNRKLADIVIEAAAALPVGWRLEIADGPVVTEWIGLSVELRLVDERDRPLPRFCRIEAGPIYAAYRRLADQIYTAQRRLYPEFDGRLAWGGKFTAADGCWDVGHFDLAGPRGRGRYQPPR